jgi:hypothetical protein
MTAAQDSRRKLPQRNPSLLPISEAADRFRVSKRSLQRYVAAGKLLRYRRGFDARTFVDRRQVERLLRPRAV